MVRRFVACALLLITTGAAAAVVQGTYVTAIRTDRAVGLGRDSCQAGSVVAQPVVRGAGDLSTWPAVGQPLVLGTDYSIDLAACEVRALRDVPGLVRFSFSYDDHAAERAAEAATIEQERTSLRTLYTTARGWLALAGQHAAIIIPQAHALATTAPSPDSVAKVRADIQKLAQAIEIIEGDLDHLQQIQDRILVLQRRAVGEPSEGPP